MDLEIRQATPDDAEVIHRFICELARYEREPEAVKNTPGNLRLLQIIAVVKRVVFCSR